MPIKNHIPNTLTCLNLFCGCVAIAFASNNYTFGFAAELILLAAVFDFFDGFAARLLNAHSPIGKDLDSLADVVSFGVAPGIILFNYAEKYAYAYDGQFGLQAVWISCFLIPVFSALRLARFNNDSRQTSHFIGLPTPANALFIITLPFLAEHAAYGVYAEKILLNTYGFIALCVLLSAALVAPFPLLSAKINFRQLGKYPFHLAFAAVAVALVAWLQIGASPLVFAGYFLFSALHFYFLKPKA